MIEIGPNLMEAVRHIAICITIIATVWAAAWAYTWEANDSADR